MPPPPPQAHRHLSTGWNKDAPFKYGYDYHFVLYVLTVVHPLLTVVHPLLCRYDYHFVLYVLTSNLKLARHSAEFMFPSLETTDERGRGAEGLEPTAEGVQFVMSAVWVGADEARLALTYGINDCESAVWQATFAEVDGMLEFTA